MIKVSLICQNGASTGLVVKKMREYALKENIDVEISAYADSQLSNIIEDKDIILLGPQVAFKKTSFDKAFPQYASKIRVISTMDFGMMNGEKILKDALEVIKTLR